MVEIPLCDIEVDSSAEGVVNKTIPEYKELLESIKIKGVVTPVIVAPRDSKYKLVTGLYRYAASVDAGKETIPAHVSNMTDAEILETQLIQCVHKVVTKPMDYQKALQRLVKHYPIEEIAKKLDKSVDWIKKKLKGLTFKDLPIAHQFNWNGERYTKIAERLLDRGDACPEPDMPVEDLGLIQLVREQFEDY